MPTFEVDLYEGNEVVTYEVDAADEEEAQRKAVAAREQYFQQETSRAALEREKSDIQQELDRDPYNIGAVHAGIAEGFNELKGGIVDSALNIAEGITTGLASLRGPQTAGGAAAAQKLNQKIQGLRDSNVVDTAKFSAKMHENVIGRPLTEAEIAQNLEETAQFIKKGKFATDVALGMGTGAATLAAKTATGMIALGALEGGIGGYLMADSQGATSIADAIDKRAGEAKFGAVLGTGLSTIPAIFAGAKNWLGARITKAGGGEERIGLIRRGLQRLGIETQTPGQVTRDPDLLLAESQAANRQAQEMYNEQASQVAQGLAQEAGIALPEISQLLRGSRQAIRDGIDFASQTFGKMRGDRNKAFEQGLEALAKETGEAPVIPVTKFVAEANEIIRGLGDSYGASTPLGRVAKDIISDINKANAAGGLTAKQANSIFLRLSALRKTGVGFFDSADDFVKANADSMTRHTRKIAKTLRDSLLADMGNVQGPAGIRLGRLRDEYGAASNRIARLEDAFNTTLGIDGTPAQVLAKLESADPASVDAFVSAMRGMDGGQEVLDNLTRYLFEDSVRVGSAAMRGQAARLGDFDIAAFLTNLQRTTEDSRLRALLTPDQERNLMSGVKLVRELLNSEALAGSRGVIKTHFTAGLENLAINAMSRDPGFMARLVGATVQRGKGAENLFFTKAGQDLLFNARNVVLQAKGSGAALQGANATVATMGSMIGAGEMERLLQEYLQSEEMEQRQ